MLLARALSSIDRLFSCLGKSGRHFAWREVRTEESNSERSRRFFRSRLQTPHPVSRRELRVKLSDGTVSVSRFDAENGRNQRVGNIHRSARTIDGMKAKASVSLRWFVRGG